MADTQVAPDQQQAPDTLPADFFQTKGTATSAPDTLPADFKFKETPEEKPQPSIMHNVGEYGSGVANSVGLPESAEEYRAASKDMATPSNVAQQAALSATGAEPLAQLGKQIWGTGKGVYQGIKEAGKEAYEAGQNVAAGRPILEQAAKPASAFVNTMVGAVPFIGSPTVQAGKDITAGNYAHAAGELTGAIGQVALPEVLDRVHPEQTMDFHNKAVEAAQKKLDTAKKAAEPYADSVAKGVLPPNKYQAPIEKAQTEVNEATFHRDTHRDAMDARRTHVTNPKAPAAAPEVPTEQIEAMKRPGAPKPAAAPENVKVPGHDVVKATEDKGKPTGIPKVEAKPEPKAEAPAPKPTGIRDMNKLKVNEKGEVIDTSIPQDKLHALLQKALEPETPKAEATAPTAEKLAERGGERRQNAVPVEEERRTGERRNAAGLKVDAEGNPVMSPDVEGHWQAGAFGEKPVEDIGAKAREVNPEPTQEETKGKPVLPKEEPTGYAAKKEEVVPAGEEGREPAKSAAEYHPAVQEQVFHLSNVNLDKMAKAYGIDPAAPEYSRSKEMRTEGSRHQVGRQKLAEDITAQLSDEEKINIGRGAEDLEHNAEMAGKTKAERAASLFPKLREGEYSTYGAKNTGVTREAYEAAKKAFNDKATRSNAGFDPTMLADAAKAAAYHIEAGARAFADFSAKMVEDFGEGIRPYLKDLHTKASEEALGKETAKTSAKDTDHMQAAIKELGPDAKLSGITKRAQEMKDSHAQVAAHNENGGSTFHPTKGDLNGKPAFSVGGEPEFKSPDLKMTTNGKELTTAQRDEFANRPAVKEALDKHKDASIGTWYDKETDKTTTELVKTPTDRAEAIAMGKKNGEKVIYDLGKGEEIKTGGTGEGPAKGEAFPDKIERPTTTTPKGGSDLPTRDALVKKYGETKTNDPKGITFILDDGTKIPNTGVDHNQMVGGKTNTVKNSSLERFMDEGNIRVRESQGTAGRMVAISIPKSGVNAIQWEAIKAMGPQLRSGSVAFEIGNLGGKYETIGYGEATDERMQQSINNITGKGEAPKSLGSAAAGTAFGKEAPLTPKQLQERLPDLAQQHLSEDEKTGLSKLGEKKKKSPYGNMR